MPANTCKCTETCVCATELEKRKIAKTSHSAQTEPSGLDFAAMFSGLSSMLDGVGPWIPYIGGSAIFIMLLGLLSKNVDKLLGMFELEFEEKPASPAPLTAAYVPSAPPEGDSCQVKCAFRINKDKVKWPYD